MAAGGALAETQWIVAGALNVGFAGLKVWPELYSVKNIGCFYDLVTRLSAALRISGKYAAYSKR